MDRRFYCSLAAFTAGVLLPMAVFFGGDVLICAQKADRGMCNLGLLGAAVYSLWGSAALLIASVVLGWHSQNRRWTFLWGVPSILTLAGLLALALELS